MYLLLRSYALSSNKTHPVIHTVSGVIYFAPMKRRMVKGGLNGIFNINQHQRARTSKTYLNYTLRVQGVCSAA